MATDMMVSGQMESERDSAGIPMVAETCMKDSGQMSANMALVWIRSLMAAAIEVNICVGSLSFA